MALKVCVALDCPSFDGGLCFGGGGIGMAHGDAHAASRGMCDQFDGSGQFWREGHQADMALGGIEKAIEERDVGRKQMFGRLHAAFGMGEERTLEVDAEGAGPAGSAQASRCGWPVQTERQRGVEGRGDGGGEVSFLFRAMPEMCRWCRGLGVSLPSRRGRRRRGNGRRKTKDQAWRRENRSLARPGLLLRRSRLAMESMLPSSTATTG